MNQSRTARRSETSASRAILSQSASDGCTFRVSAIEHRNGEISFKVNDDDFTIRSFGEYNVMNAAAAIGDDTLQKRSSGQARQETFTHGTSQQRVHWFMKGLETGDPAQGDTFSSRQL